MENNNDLQKDNRNAIQSDLPVSGTETGTFAKVVRNINKIILIASLAGAGIFFNGCTTTGYVQSEPVYVEKVRPPQPSTVHTWVDGEWVYSRQSHSYVRKGGYWQRPSQRRTYISGNWQSSPRGHYWRRGHWHRNGR